MDHSFSFLLPLIPLLATVLGDTGAGGSCQAISIPLCKKDLLYNHTIMPTLLGHRDQEEAARDTQQFRPFLRGRCSRALKLFVCAVYAPVCTILQSAIPPCRAVCARARQRCGAPMTRAGFVWPEALRCEQFPEAGLCVEAAEPEPLPDTPAETPGADTPAETRPGADTPAETPGADTPAETRPGADTPAETPGADTPAETRPGADTPAKTWPGAADQTQDFLTELLSILYQWLQQGMEHIQIKHQTDPR